MTQLILPSGRTLDTDLMDGLTIEDVAAVLAKIERWRGMLSPSHSVCSHSVNVALLLLDRYQHPGIALLGLLHDLDEVFVGDIPAPIKAVLVDESALEMWAERALFQLLPDELFHALLALAGRECVRAAVRCADLDVTQQEVAASGKHTNAQEALHKVVVGEGAAAFDGGCISANFGDHSEEEFVNMFRNLVEQFNAVRKHAKGK